MKILWHMPTLRRRGCGLSTRAIDLAQRVRNDGPAVTFLVEQDKTDVTDARIGGLPLLRMKVTRKRPLHWSLQAAARREAARRLVERCLDDGGPAHDLLISCQPEVVAAYAEHPRRRPLIFVCGGTTLLHDEAEAAEQESLSWFRRLGFCLDRRLKHVHEAAAFAAADAVVFDSDHTRNLVVDAYSIAAAGCHTIHGGVDEDCFRPPTPDERQTARTNLGLSEMGYVIVWTGRLSPEKNLNLLLHAVAQCSPMPEQVLVVGGGPLRADLERLSVSLGLAGRAQPGKFSTVRSPAGVVRFLGPQDDVRPFLHAADVFAFPSRGESFGGAMAEAMATGLACVALRPDGLRVRNANCEIIEHARTGLLVDHASPAGFAAVLELLGVDTALRRRLGAAGRSRALAHFTWNLGARKLVDLISKLVPIPVHSDIHSEGSKPKPVNHRTSDIPLVTG